MTYKNKRRLLSFGTTVALIWICLSCNNTISENANEELGIIIKNPVIPGDFGDPCIVQFKDTFYLYAAAGNSKYASVWYSTDFENWKMRKLDWPTTALGSYIWAPKVVRGKDKRFYFFTTVESNIFVGVSDHPMGPFHNLLPNEQPLIKNKQFWDEMHTIDADCFIDDDGQAYLYWGSGFDFRNGQCAAVRLNDDMCSFKEEPRLITPSNFFEGPRMIKRNKTYYLIYSDGIFLDDTYKIRYATSKSPLGPFIEGATSPILSTSEDGKVRGPGHPSIFRNQGKDFIIYQRHAIPVSFPNMTPLRQICIDEMNIDEFGSIEKIKPNKNGIQLLSVFSNPNDIKPLPIHNATASSDDGKIYNPDKAFDGNRGTLWSVSAKNIPAWLNADLGSVRIVESCSPVFDQIDGDYDYIIEYSKNNKDWHPYGIGNNSKTKEWPVIISKKVDARYIRIHIYCQDKNFYRSGLWEFNIFGPAINEIRI